MFVQDCTNCSFKITGKIVSATLEAYRNTGVNVECHSPVLTAQVDASKDFTIKFTDKEFFRMLIWAGCDNLTVEVGVVGSVKTGMEHMRAEYQNLRADIDQFKVHFIKIKKNNNNNKIEFTQI